MRSRNKPTVASAGKVLKLKEFAQFMRLFGWNGSTCFVLFFTSCSKLCTFKNNDIR